MKRNCNWLNIVEYYLILSALNNSVNQPKIFRYAVCAAEFPRNICTVVSSVARKGNCFSYHRPVTFHSSKIRQCYPIACMYQSMGVQACRLT